MSSLSDRTGHGQAVASKGHGAERVRADAAGRGTMEIAIQCRD